MTAHNLTIHSRYESDRKDGECSCGQWRARNHPREEIGRMHAEHVRREAKNG